MAGVATPPPASRGRAADYFAGPAAAALRSLRCRYTVGRDTPKVLASSCTVCFRPSYIARACAIRVGVIGAAHLNYDRVTGSSTQPWSTITTMAAAAAGGALIIATATLSGTGGRLTADLLRRE